MFLRKNNFSNANNIWTLASAWAQNIALGVRIEFPQVIKRIDSTMPLSGNCLRDVSLHLHGVSSFSKISVKKKTQKPGEFGSNRRGLFWLELKSQSLKTRSPIRANTLGTPSIQAANERSTSSNTSILSASSVKGNFKVRLGLPCFDSVQALRGRLLRQVTDTKSFAWFPPEIKYRSRNELRFKIPFKYVASSNQIATIVTLSHK